MHPKGFGFVSDEARDLSAFMPPPLLNRFLQDDVVEALEVVEVLEVEVDEEDDKEDDEDLEDTSE